MDKAVDAAVRQQNALMGLASVAKGTGNSMEAATKAAESLAADGLMPIGDAATGLKNLLASGFSLPQAIRLMEAFKDSAAFGRQGSLEFGQAVASATEGIKNGNSILVDNAGVTKNLSNILVDAGYSAQDLAKAGDDAGVRMALFNGIIKETRNQTGDAAKLTESFGGSVARMETQVTKINVAIGEALQPILAKVIDTLAPLVQKFLDFAKNNPALVAAIAAFVTIGLSLVTVLGLVGSMIGFIISSGIGVLMVKVLAVVGVIAALVAALIFLEMKFGLVSKAIQWVKDALSSLGKKVSEVFNSIMSNSAVQGVISFIGGTFKQIWADLQGIFEQLSKALQPVFDAFSKVFDAIGGFLSKHGKTIMNVFKGIGIALGAIAIAPLAIAFGAFLVAIKAISLVLGFINKHFETIKKVILVILAVALAPLIASVVLLVAAFKAVVWIVKTLWTVFTTVFNAVWVVISTVFNAIMVVWNTVLKPVFNAIIYILKALFTIWWTIFSGIMQIVGTVVSTIAKIIFVILKGVFLWVVNNFLKPLFNFYSSIFKAIWNVVSSIFSAIWRTISSILGGIYSVVRSVFNSILGFVRGVWNWIRNAIISPIRSAYNAIAGVIGNIKDKVVSGIRSAINAVGNFVSNAVTAGKNLIDGLVRGIGNAKDAVVNKIKDICGGALDAVKSFFGISSPSRVMAEMGGYLMDGLQTGIQKAGGAVVNAATDISDKIAGGMQDSLQNVSDGARSVVGVYRGMYGQLSAMDMAQAATMNGSVSAMNNAAASSTNGGAIAQPPINVTLKQDGIVARSRGEFRDIIADGIEAVNEDLRARGYDQIGNGKVKGNSTAS